MDYRDTLKKMREELGISQAELANNLHISVSTVRRWELGKTHPSHPIASQIFEYAHAHNVSDSCLNALRHLSTSTVKEKPAAAPVAQSSLQHLIDDASFAIFVCDMETDEVLYLNQKAGEIIGDVKDAIGKKCYECLIHQDTPCESCQKGELTAHSFKSYTVYRPSDGTNFFIQGKLIQWNGRKAQVKYVIGQSSSPKPLLGKITASNTSAQDQNTAAKALILQGIENEKHIAQLKDIFENINGGVSVAVYDEDDKVRQAYANEHYYALFGYTRQQYALEHQNPQKTVYPDDVAYTNEMISKVKRTREAVTFRYRIVRRDKRIAHIRCSSSVSSIEGLGDKVLISVLTDITETVMTEQKAALSEIKLKAVLSNINCAVTAAVVHADGFIKINYANELFHQMLGYTKEQYQKEVTNPFLLIHPDDMADVQRRVTGLRHEGDSSLLKYRVVMRDGKTKWLKGKFTLMSFPDSEELVQFAIYTDITDIMEATEQIAAQHQQIVNILNETPSGIAIVELDLRDPVGTLKTKYYNDRFYQFSGYNREEYDAHLKENSLFFIFDEDVPALTRDTFRVCEEGIGASVETMVRCHLKGGGYRWLLLTGQLTERQGDICVINVALMDVTERQQAVDRQRINEEMLRIAAETDKRIMVIYDVKNNACRVESRTLFSAKFGEQLANIPQSIIARGIVARNSVDELCAMFARIRKGEEKITVSLQLQSDADKYEWFECNATTVFDNNGLPDHAVLVLHNITEQRVKEAVFKKWQQSISARPQESYTLFRCNLSKDASLDESEGKLLKIKLPPEVTPFNSRTKLYVDEYVYPDDREAYTALMDSDMLLAMFYRGEHEITHEYRETVENGEAVWRRLTVEMVEYLNSTDVQAFLMFEDIDEQKKKELAEKAQAESDPLTGALNRVAFLNKINEIIADNPTSQNALIMLDMDGFKHLNDVFGHAAGDQALQDVVAVLRSYVNSGDLVCRMGGDEFLVWLRDVPYDAVIAKTAQQMCEHIHKAYSQEVALSASAGIAIYPRDGHSFDELYPKADKALYKVKQAEKGSYAFYSATVEAETPEIAKALSAVRQYAPNSPKAKRRMLIVDDNEINRLTLKEIFSDEFIIETAKNGPEALIHLRHFGVSICVVLLDLMMPGMDGFTVLRKMQDNGDMRTIPVIIVSGDEERSSLLKAMELGAAEYVTKPIDVDFVRLRVHSVISKAENERLRAQNSYLMLQRNEEEKYQTVLESTGTVVVEYDWYNHVFVYDGEISKYIAGNFDHRGLWQVFLSDMVAESTDVKIMQDALRSLASNRESSQDSKLVRLKTPEGEKHWYRMFIYKRVNEFGLAEKMYITFNDVDEEVLAHEKLLFQATRDKLTGLYNRAGFIEKAAEMIAAKEPGYYVMSCIDIEKFKVINDQYGTKRGDDVLIKFARAIDVFHRNENGICCRIMADNFAILYPTQLLDSQALADSHKNAAFIDKALPSLRFAVGRCIVDDKTLDVSAIYDRAALAKETVKGRYDTHIATYDETMRTSLLRQQEIIAQMNQALEQKQFEVWLQPQFNHASGKLIGAEALVRWRHPVEGLISPAEFIPIFERNGFVYEVDKYVWEQACSLLRKWLNEGLDPVPVSVNISRYDLFSKDLISVIEGLVDQYDLPRSLLRLEITESAFSESSTQIVDVVTQLVNDGFTVEIDDFGSGYSSLNTLKDVPATVLKLDMRFFEKTEHSDRGGSIVESMVRMATLLGMAVIAEGVEEKAQADYLKSIGCNYIQGYYYSRPLCIADYEQKMIENDRELQLSSFETLETLDSNRFWDPKSMETLIFNSYVGGACILEACNNTIEMLRINDQWINELNGLVPAGAQLKDANIADFLDDEERQTVINTLITAQKTGRAASCELHLTNGTQVEYIRYTARMIAKTNERQLFYSVIVNITEQRLAEKKQVESAERLSIIMSNVNGGVSALEVNDDGTSRLIFHNEKYYELYGYSRADAAEQELDPLGFITPEDFPSVMEKLKKLKADGQPIVIDYSIIKRDGRHAQIRANSSLMMMEGYGPIITSVLTDVTEQRTLSDQLRAIIDNINGGVSAVYLKDGVPEFVIVNDKYFEIIGYTQEEFNAEVSNIFTLIHPDDRARIEQLVRESSVSEKPFGMEYRIIRRNGAIRHILCNTNVIHMFGVEEPVLLAVTNDITMLRDSQERERSLATQMRTIMANIHGGITATVYHDKDNIELIFSNEGFYTLYGYTKEQLETELPNMLDLILPEDREKTMETVARIIRERGSASYEYRCRKRNGSIIWTQATSAVISLEGIGDDVVLAIATDITELRHTEHQNIRIKNQLQTIMNTMTNGMAAVALRGDQIEFLFANNRYYEMHGISKKNWVQKNIADALVPVFSEDRARVRELILSTNKVGQTAQTEYRILHPDGTVHWTKLILSVAHISDVEVPVQVAIYADITVEKEAADQLRFLNESAHSILSQPDSELAINDTLRKLMDYFAGERAYIFELHDESQTSDNTYELCAPGVTPEIKRLQNVPYAVQNIWFDTFNSVGFVAIPDISAMPEQEADMRELLLVQNIRSIIVSPLRRDGRLIGYMGIDNPTMAVDQVESLSAVADYVAILLTRRDLMREIEHKKDGDMHRLNSQLDEDSPRTRQMDSDKLNRRLLDNLPFGAGMYEFDGKALTSYHINKRYESLVDRSVNSTESAPIEFIHPADRSVVFSELLDAIENGRDAHCDIRLLCGADQYKPFHLDAAIEKQENGKYMVFVAYTPIPEHEMSFRSMMPQMFAKIMESSTDLAFAKDINFRYICCSKTFAQLLGLSSEQDVVGKTDYELFSNEIANLFRRDDSALLATEKPLVDIQEMLPSPDGTPHYIRTSKHLLRGSSGEIIGIYCTGREVTEIREAFSQLKLLTDTIPGGIANFRCMPGKIEIVYINDGVCTLIGVTREEFERHPINMLDIIFDEDKPIIHQQIELLINGVTELDFTFRIHTKEGRKWIKAVGHTTDHMGDVYYVSTVLTDVTTHAEEQERLRLAEEEYRIAALHSNRVICRYDIAEQTLNISEDVAARTGLPTILRGVPYERVRLGKISEDTQDTYIAFFEKIMHGERECSAAYRKLLPSGWRWIEANATTIFTNEGKPASAIVLFADVTEQREKESVYNRWQNSLAERPLDSYTLFRCNLSQYSSFESQEGNLLNVGFDENNHSFDERTNEYIEQCVYAEDRERYRAFMRADTMLAEYYRGHRSDSIEYREFLSDGTIRWLRLNVDLVEYRNSSDVEAYLMYENIDEEKRSQLRIVERAETDPLTGVFNRTTFASRVNQIISSSKPGTRHALLMLDIDGFKLVNDVFGHGAGDQALCDVANLLTRISRKDDLVGRLGGDEFFVFLSDIPNETVVANKAQQICELTRKNFSVSVYISSSIGIAMYPADGEGFESMYKVADETLYRVKNSGKNGYAFSNDELKMVSAASEANVAASAEPGMNKVQHRMLIVDDNLLDRTIMTELFKNDFQIDTANDGTSALTKLRHYGSALSVMLLDLMMPGIDGFEVLRKMQQDESTRTIPVIVVSADDDRDTVMKVIEAGASELIKKPVDMELLRVRVKSVISKAEGERLRAQNSYLAMRNMEANSYKSVLERSGVLVITFDCKENGFSYSPAVSQQLDGRFDGRTLWSILKSDKVTDVKTVEQMQKLVNDVSEINELHDGNMTVRLKTRAGVFRMYSFDVFREEDDRGVAVKIIMSLKEAKA